MIDILIYAAIWLFGGACGAWVYRYYLRKDPAKLESIARQIRAAARNVS